MISTSTTISKFIDDMYNQPIKVQLTEEQSRTNHIIGVLRGYDGNVLLIEPGKIEYFNVSKTFGTGTQAVLMLSGKRKCISISAIRYFEPMRNDYTIAAMLELHQNIVLTETIEGQGTFNIVVTNVGF